MSGYVERTVTLGKIKNGQQIYSAIRFLKSNQRTLRDSNSRPFDS
jgi:hypothetical protein